VYAIKTNSYRCAPMMRTLKEPHFGWAQAQHP